MASPSHSQRSVSEALQDIVGNLQQVVRDEFRLAKVGVEDKAHRAARPASILAAGTVLGVLWTWLPAACGGLRLGAGHRALAHGSARGRRPSSLPSLLIQAATA
jgi:hypothetical protein